MNKPFDDTNRGALFKNERKTEDTHADSNGSINTVCPKCKHPTDWWLNGWTKISKAGKKYVSLSVKQKDGQPAPGNRTPGAGPSQKSVKEDMDDEIPF